MDFQEIVVSFVPSLTVFLNRKRKGHINWGWKGKSDGYFKKGTFSTTDRYSVDDLIDTETEQVSAQNYTWDYRLVTYGDWN